MCLPGILKNLKILMEFGRYVSFSDQTFFVFSVFFDGTSLVVLTHGFQKKSQKTPQNAIRVAEERKREYIKRRAK